MDAWNRDALPEGATSRCTSAAWAPWVKAGRPTTAFCAGCGRQKAQDDLANSAEALRYSTTKRASRRVSATRGSVSVHDFVDRWRHSVLTVHGFDQWPNSERRIRNYISPRPLVPGRTGFLWTQLLQALAGFPMRSPTRTPRGVLQPRSQARNILVGEFGEVVIIDWGMAARSQPTARSQRQPWLARRTTCRPSRRMDSPTRAATSSASARFSSRSHRPLPARLDRWRTSPNWPALVRQAEFPPRAN